MKLYIRTWGCQMNVLDSQVLEGEFAAAGLHRRFEPRGRRRHHPQYVQRPRGRREQGLLPYRPPQGAQIPAPEVKVVVAGCMAQRLGRRHHPPLPAGRPRGRNAPHRRGARHRSRGGRRRARGVHIEDEYGPYPSRDVSFRSGPSQAFVSVMRGCDNFCAYCIVPYVRGSQVSRPESEMLEEVRALAADGVKEVTLLGQNVTSYGRDRGEKGALAKLLETLHANRRPRMAQVRHLAPARYRARRLRGHARPAQGVPVPAPARAVRQRPRPEGDEAAATPAPSTSPRSTCCARSPARSRSRATSSSASPARRKRTSSTRSTLVRRVGVQELVHLQVLAAPRHRRRGDSRRRAARRQEAPQQRASRRPGGDERRAQPRHDRPDRSRARRRPVAKRTQARLCRPHRGRGNRDLRGARESCGRRLRRSRSRTPPR